MTPTAATAVPTLPFRAMSDAEARAALAKYRIGLTLDEARKIEELLKRPPTVVEAVIWGIQGSEHSSYKSSRRFLRMFPTSGKHVILGPKEDSGIVAITDGPPGKRWGLVVSHESHNHPSQIVPFEGAATGVGGTVRDVVCMGARVVGCLDCLRLGDLGDESTRTIATEVIRGIGGYGNPLGIPNLGGDTVFDAGFNSNCLVNAIAVGMVREDQVIHSEVPEEAAGVGYDLILVGKPTDRSGFGGAAFASLSIAAGEEERNTGAVQEPNPFLERHLLASTYALFDWLAQEGRLHRVSFKDLGAGGVVCSTVEQVAGRDFGAEVDLDAVHVSLRDLPPEVIACAETQERFCWACHPDLTTAILRHYNETWGLPSIAEGARASVIGKVTPGGIYRLRHKGSVVCEARSRDITQGLQYERPTKLEEELREEPAIRCEGDAVTVRAGDARMTTTIGDVFRAMIGHPNHASKARAFGRFDKTVIGNTVVEAGEGDAGVIAPLQDLGSVAHLGADPGWGALPETDRWRGVACAGDGNPRYGRISAYWQGANAVIESMCNVAAVGALPRALTDCLNYGNPEIPAQLAALEEGVRGISDAARGAAVEGEAVPVISGNVSLYNATADGRAIPPSAIVCCFGVLKDARRAATMRIKRAGSRIVLLGERRDECGGSAYYEILEGMIGTKRDALLGQNIPKPDFASVAAMIRVVNRAVDEGLVLSCHDVSDGGLLLALFEMLLPQRKEGGDLGARIDLAACGPDLRSDVLLFSQTPGFLMEVPESSIAGLTALGDGLWLRTIGDVLPTPSLEIRRDGKTLFAQSTEALRKTWSNALQEKLSSIV